MSAIDRRTFIQSAAVLGSSGALVNAAHAEPSPATSKRKFKLGLVTDNLGRNWDLPTLLNVCEKTAVAAVELRSSHKHGVEPVLLPDQRREARKRFADSGVACWGCGTNCEFHSTDPNVVRANVEICKQFVQLTADIGGRGVRVRPDALPRAIPAEVSIAQIGKALAECGKAAADAGVEIWVELHGIGSSVPKHMQMIMEACGHEAVGLSWNCNGQDVAFASISEAFGLLKKWLKSCHISDLYNDEKGGYPYRELFRSLRETGYDRYTLCQVSRPIADPLAGMEFLRYYYALWHELSKE